MNIKKKCSNCEIKKFHSEYHKNNQTKDGICGMCKTCRMKKQAQVKIRQEKGLNIISIDEKVSDIISNKAYSHERKQDLLAELLGIVGDMRSGPSYSTRKIDHMLKKIDQHLDKQ